jgi:hypothetical protein
LREIAGWVLLVASFVLFGEAIYLVLNKRIVSAGPFLFIAFVVFRGGLHLLKVASAARACREIHQQNRTTASSRRVMRMGPSAATLTGVPRASVVPGEENTSPPRL